MMGCVCGAGGYTTLNTIYDEYSNLIASAFESLGDLGDSLAETFNNYLDIYNDIPFISIPTKKKLKYKRPVYKMNYIQPQIKKSKYLPYQRRVY